MRKQLLGIILFIVLSVSQVHADTIFSMNYTSLDGQSTSFSKFSGKPLLLDTFATWCEPCKTEILNLMNMYDSLSPHVHLLTLDVSPNTDGLSSIKSYKEDFGAQWEFGSDTKGDFISKYSTIVIPTLYLFDKDGGFLHQWVGVTSQSQLKSDLESILHIQIQGSNSNFFSQISDQLLANGLFKITASFVLISLVYILVVPTKPELDLPDEKKVPT